VTESAFAAADRLLSQALDALAACADTGGDAELIAMLGRCENAVRRLDRITVSTVGGLERSGGFAARGYKSSAAALADLLGWERPEARRRVAAAEQVTPRIGLDGTVLPARLPAPRRPSPPDKQACATSTPSPAFSP
jgi:5-methylcytosine-specific restriction protein A